MEKHELRENISYRLIWSKAAEGLQTKDVGRYLNLSPSYICFMQNPTTWDKAPAYAWRKAWDWYISNCPLSEYKLNKDEKPLPIFQTIVRRKKRKQLNFLEKEIIFRETEPQHIKSTINKQPSSAVEDSDLTSTALKKEDPIFVVDTDIQMKKEKISKKMKEPIKQEDLFSELIQLTRKIEQKHNICITYTMIVQEEKEFHFNRIDFVKEYGKTEKDNQQ